MTVQPVCLRVARAHYFLPAFAAILGACGGGDGGGQPPAPPPDITPPSVTVTALPGTVNRTVTLQVSAADNVGVASVEFRVDGTLIATDSAAPFSANWDTGTVTDAQHAISAVARDAAGNSTTSAAVNVTVRNQVQFALLLSGAAEDPPRSTSGSGSATLDINLASGAVSGSVTVTGFTSTAAHIHDAFAGTSGPIAIGLQQDAADPATWRVAAGATLSAANVDRLLAGALYLNVHSAQFPGGEVRSQILPSNLRVFFASLDGAQEASLASPAGTGHGAVTVNTDTRAVVVQVKVNGVNAPTAARLRQAFAGANGPTLASLTQDTADANHFSVEGTTLTQAAYDALLAGAVYVSVESAANPNGHVRGQALPPGIFVTFTALEGLQEIPVVVSSVRARGAVTVNASTRVAAVHLNAQGADNATAAHLHSGVAGTEGGILVGLTQDGSAPGHWLVENATLSQADYDALIAARTYLNLHTPANPGGEVRGQVVPPGILVTIDVLAAGQEVPATASTGSGAVAATVHETTRAAEFHINALGVDDAIAAHIHQGYAGVNGPIAVGLNQDAADPGHWSASAVTLTADQLAALRAGALYGNVHTPALLAGAIRGQLVPDNVRLVFSALDGQQEVPPVTTNATGLAASTADLSASTLTIHVNTSDVDDAVQAHVHRGVRGVAGPIEIGLTQDATVVSRWSAVAAALTASQRDALLAGELYVNVHTPANPDGEIRGQIELAVAPPPDTSAPTVTLGAVAATLSGTVTLAATATDDVGVTLIRFRVNGNVVGTDTTAPYAFDWNTTTVANGPVSIVAEAQDAAGNVGTSTAVAATVSNGGGPGPYTFTEIQNQIFTPRCIGCHSGPGAPVGLQLNAGVSYGNLVGVASGEVPTLQRVQAGNAGNSYLIHKLEGTQSVGSRMPLGGPFLDQATIDRIRAWINAGAPNN